MFPSPLDMLDDIVVNDFTEKSANEFRNKVMKIAKLDPHRPIVIYIDSYGGSLYALGSMLSVMEEAPNMFITVSTGKSMSCGAMLLAAGDMRFADKHSALLIHEISAGAIGDVHDIANTAQNIVQLNEKWMTFLADKCGKKGGFKFFKDLIKEQDGRDIYLDPAQAKEFGLVDYIGSPFIQPMVMYQVANTNEADPVKNNTDDEGEQEAMLAMLQDLASKQKTESKKKTKKKTTKKKVTKKVTKKVAKKVKK